jgi:hypothetical protein
MSNKWNTAIAIDFQGGQHGCFLDYICNRFLAGVDARDDPFSETGAAHNAYYFTPKKFVAQHYFGYGNQRFTPNTGPIISITCTQDDLLPLTAISLLRAGDYNIDNNKLHKYTYWKLNNSKYRWLLDLLNRKYVKYQLDISYGMFKKSDWPNVESITEYFNLPEAIRIECEHKHKLLINELDEDNADCPRPLVIEFFKDYFKSPAHSEFMRIQKQKMVYTNANDVYYFPYSAFYSRQDLLYQMRGIADWTGYQMNDVAAFEKLHDDFLGRQPYYKHRTMCDEIFQDIIAKKISVCPKIDLLQESYLLSRLEQYYNHSCINNLSFYIAKMP